MHKPHGNKKINIFERKLGRERAYGLFWNKKQAIEIDPRLSARKYLYVLIHELLHHAQQELTEEGVIRVAKLVSKGVWQQGYRRIQK